MISVFVSYSHVDEDLQKQLQIHLTMLVRQEVIDIWHDRRIGAGEEIDGSIEDAMEDAQVVLLLVSPDFLASDYCYDSEVARAMERHDANEARVIPVILRPCDWHGAPFGKLRATPRDGRPVVQWTNIDEAFVDVTRDVRAAVEKIVGSRAKPSKTPARATTPSRTTASTPEGPRSSNLRIRAEFTEAEADRFLRESFEFMAKYFQNSLDEMAGRNPVIEVDFNRVDANTFTAAIYRKGECQSRCRVWIGGMGNGDSNILYSHSTSGNGYNESMSVEAGDQMLGLRPIGLMQREQSSLTQEGAAEYYWSAFIEPLQR